MELQNRIIEFAQLTITSGIYDFDEPEIWEYKIHKQKCCVSEPNIKTQMKKNHMET